jgi:hypothetical protein
MTQTVVIRRPEEVVGRFGELAHRRADLVEKEARLIRKGEVARNRGENEEVARVALDLNGVRSELAGIQGDYGIVELDAREAARGLVTGHKGYRRLVSEAAAALSAHLEPWLALDAVIKEAGTSGIRLVPVPAVVQMEIASAKRWVRAQVATGVLDVSTLPMPLRALVEEAR